MKNAIKQRLPKSAENLKQLESKFIEGVEKTALQDLSLDELANRLEDIGQQAQLMQGQILLEARSRFAGDREFGQWRASSLWSCSPSQCTRLIQLARFFSESRPLENISVTVAYEISAPANADIADEIYAYAKENKPSVAEIKKQIAIRKGEKLPLPTKQSEQNLATDVTPVMPEAATDISELKIEAETNLKAKIYADIGDTPPFDALRILKEISDEIRAKVYRK